MVLLVTTQNKSLQLPAFSRLFAFFSFRQKKTIDTTTPRFTFPQWLKILGITFYDNFSENGARKCVFEVDDKFKG